MPRNSSIPMKRRLARGGFTLLELCIVLFIIALLAGTAMPAMNSAFAEQALRDDAHQISLMAKTAMIQSAEQQRAYVMTWDGRQLMLHPQAAPADEGDVTPDDGAAPRDVTQTQVIRNALLFPDAQKKAAWEKLPAATWTFTPGALCPLPRLRIERGNAYIEMSFDALTGDVEDESVSLP